MKHKLIMESWRSFLKEEGEYDASQKPKLQDLISKDYASFVAELKANIADPKFQEFLKMGVEDGSSDDVVTVQEVDIPVKNLFPTQSQIGLADSLGWISANKPKGAGTMAGLPANSTADIGGRIVTANGKYIVDGHHRWSQVYLLNPDLKIPTYNFVSKTLPDKDPAKGALKLAHLAIAAVDKAVPLVPADAATDVYKTGGNLDSIKKILNNPKVISEPAAKALMEVWNLGSREEVVAKVAEHAITLFESTKSAAAKGPKRGLMPQTGKVSDPTTKTAEMEKGAVNWNPKA